MGNLRVTNSMWLTSLHYLHSWQSTKRPKERSRPVDACSMIHSHGDPDPDDENTAPLKF